MQKVNKIFTNLTEVGTPLIVTQNKNVTQETKVKHKGYQGHSHTLQCQTMLIFHDKLTDLSFSLIDMDDLKNLINMN